VASVTKGVTALTVMSLVADGIMALDDRARRGLGGDLPLVDDRVTIDHLLTHRSGIGDYFDEDLLEDENDYVMKLPVHRLDSAEAYLAELDGYPQVAEPGAEFVYNNGAFVILALLAERAAGRAYHDLVAERVLGPAGMSDSMFVRSDALPAGAAVGYLEPDGLRTNVLHMPLLGVGDGGLYSTVDDLDRLWRAMFAGRIVPLELVGRMVERVSEAWSGVGCGRGIFLAGAGWVFLEGGDVGISTRTLHHPESVTTISVISNVTDGATDVQRLVRDVLAH
jgi:CubicO group peptidase (beta-lactamase class C family)